MAHVWLLTRQTGTGFTKQTSSMAHNCILYPLTVEEAAAALHVSPRTVRRRLQAGRLGGRKLGREWVV
jgi:excisionase family DNA binding protein